MGHFYGSNLFNPHVFHFSPGACLASAAYLVRDFPDSGHFYGELALVFQREEIPSVEAGR